MINLTVNGIIISLLFTNHREKCFHQIRLSIYTSAFIFTDAKIVNLV